MSCHALPLPARRAAAERLLDELAELAVVVVHREVAVGIIWNALIDAANETVRAIVADLGARMDRA